MRVFRSIRNEPPQTRAQLQATVAQRFRSMTDDDFAAFLQTLPAGTRDDAQRIRDGVTAH